MTEQDKNERKQKSEMPVAASTNQTNYSLKRKQDRWQRKKMLNEIVSKMTTDHAVRAIRIVFLQQQSGPIGPKNSGQPSGSDDVCPDSAAAETQGDSTTWTEDILDMIMRDEGDVVL